MQHRPERSSSHPARVRGEIWSRNSRCRSVTSEHREKQRRVRESLERQNETRGTPSHGSTYLTWRHQLFMRRRRVTATRRFRRPPKNTHIYALFLFLSFSPSFSHRLSILYLYDWHRTQETVRLTRSTLVSRILVFDCIGRKPTQLRKFVRMGMVLYPKPSELRYITIDSIESRNYM